MVQLRTLALLVLVSICAGATHAQFQVVHDVPNTSSNPQITPLILADGNTVTYLWDEGQHIFHKYDGAGTLLWSKALADGSTTNWLGDMEVSTMCADGAGGFHVATLVSVEQTPIPELFMEYDVVITWQVMHVDADGLVTSAFLVQRTSQDIDNFLYEQKGFDMVCGPEGELVLAITNEGSGPNSFIEIVRMENTGTIGWASNVGRLLNGLDQTLPFEASPKARLALSSTGGVYYTESTFDPYSTLRLAQLDADGNMIWMQRYFYGNTDALAQFHDIVVDGAGYVYAAGYINSTAGLFHCFLRTLADGTLDKGDLYRTPLVLLDGRLNLDAQGRRYHRVTTVFAPTSTLSHGILVADTLGTSAQFLRRADQVILPNNVFIYAHAFDVAGDRVALSGLLNHEHVDLAFTTRYETLASMETGALSACLFSDTALAHIEIPLEIMTTEEVTDAASIDVSSYYTSEPITLSFTSLDPEPLEGLCAFASEILGVSLGLDESSTSEQVPLVLNSLVAQGTPVVLNDAKVNAVVVYDVHGALVQRTNISAGRAIATTGWPSGVYILHAMDARGRPLRVGRVVVE